MAHLLLIDDDHSVRAMLRETLVHFGHTVTEARNGEEGLKLIEQAHPDLVITDIVMPEKDGLELLMALRKKEPRVKIIAISGGGRNGAATNFLHMAKVMGAEKTLEKPFANEVLLAAINGLLA